MGRVDAFLQFLEMGQRHARLVQITQREPAREELGFGKFFPRSEAGVGYKRIRRARVAVLQCLARIEVQLGPPALRVCTCHLAAVHALEQRVGLGAIAGSPGSPARSKSKPESMARLGGRSSIMCWAVPRP